MGLRDGHYAVGGGGGDGRVNACLYAFPLPSVSHVTLHALPVT